ncbi:hypothetical protein [Taibaiella koreensis]|uniref:hypothetical protein n=1 Tax=Taibaiella koreensis TaxID=1268548 RepID=UPI000E59E1BC|nr:hypothetical protein [Taibaiella koreensis]
MSRILTVLSRLTKNSLLLWCMASPAVVSRAAEQCAQQNREALKEGIVRFFGKEQLALMQRRSFGFVIAYGGRNGAMTVTVQRQGKDKHLSDTVAAVLKHFLEQAVAPALCREGRTSIRINERTSFDGIAAKQPPLIRLTPANTDVWNDTLKLYVARFGEQYPEDCGQLRCVRGISYAVAPLQQPVISRISYAGCDSNDRTVAFLSRFRAFLDSKLKLPYPVTAEGCVVDNFYDKTIRQVSDEERVWCIVNRFGYIRYFLFKLPATVCD